MVEQWKEIYANAAAGKEAALSFTMDGNPYVRHFRPAERLILLGCGHIGQALCRYAADLGFSVTAVDERPSFANHTQMPKAAQILYVSELNAALRSALSAYPKVRLNSPAEAIPHILNLSVSGVKGSRFRKALGEKGVCVSVKSACSADGTPSRAVYAVSRDRKNALSSWRISLSHLTTEGEIGGFLEAYDRCYKELTE